MQKSCTHCQTQFEVTPDDLKFYDKISPVFDGKKFPIPPPKMCPECRLQHRLAFRNERKLYNRKCDLTGRQIISIYSPDKPFKVYDQEAWWSDRWDAFDYGKDFDFKRTFSEQFKELVKAVPHISLNTTNAENSYYTNFSLNQKNCYLVFGGANDQDVMFGKFVTDTKDSMDLLSVYNCELCYEGIASEKCYNCKYFLYSKNCTDCFLIEDCANSQNLLMCFGLRSKKYCILNQEVGQEKYEQFIKNLGELTVEKIENLKKQFYELKANSPHIASHIYASEDCAGDMVFNSKNCTNAFDVKNGEDSKYVYFVPNVKNTYDHSFGSPGPVEFCYNCCSTIAQTSMVTFLIWFCSNTYYSMHCQNSQNLFGCIGLKNKKYCIFNKQYSKEEYEKLVAKIVEHMQKTEEWGEYFLADLSSFGYNETIAQEYFPLSKEQALKKSWNWREEVDTDKSYIGPKNQAPTSLKGVGDEILKTIFICEKNNKPYKLIKQELDFYRKMGLPIPRISPDERHMQRLSQKNPMKLWKRNCSNCQKEIHSTYSPDRPEKIFCEQCYLKLVY